jgi:hypothetical protein
MKTKSTKRRMTTKTKKTEDGGFKLDESAPADFGVDCIAWKPLGWHVTIWPTFHQYPMISKAHNDDDIVLG